MLVSIHKQLLRVIVGWDFTCLCQHGRQVPHRSRRHIKCHPTPLELPLFLLVPMLLRGNACQTSNEEPATRECTPPLFMSADTFKVYRIPAFPNSLQPSVYQPEQLISLKHNATLKPAASHSISPAIHLRLTPQIVIFFPSL